MKLAVFYHGLFYLGNPPELLPAAVEIIREQMAALKSSGLLDAAEEFHVGLNGDKETGDMASLFFPPKARIVLHGLRCRTECKTIRLLEQWLPGHKDWLVMYEHCKGATRPEGDPVRTPWRQCMQHHLVTNWRRCVKDLESVESVGCHFMQPPATPFGQHIWAGNFFFSRASYLLTLPSILLRDRIKQRGLDEVDSRFESEVWHFNGSRLPTIKDYCANWNPGRPHA